MLSGLPVPDDGLSHFDSQSVSMAVKAIGLSPPPFGFREEAYQHHQRLHGQMPLLHK